MTWTTIACVVFLVSAAWSWAWSRPAAACARRWGFVDRPGERKIHREPVPLLGGVAVWASWSLVVIMGTIAALVALLIFPDSLNESVTRVLPGLQLVAGKLVAIVVGATLMLALGLWDDKWPMGALPKFVGQVLIAVGVAAAGVRVTAFLASDVLGFLLTVLWIVTIVNAFNMFDNMDGLCSGTGAVCALLFGLIGGVSGQYFVLMLSVALAGALAGFLPHNMHPAKMFLGDAGSHFVGFSLAVIAVLTTFYGAEGGTRVAIVIPVIVLSLPLFDLASVVWIRWREGRPIHKGDTRHLSHRFLRLGFSQRVTALVIYLMTLALGSGAMILLWAPPRVLPVILIQILALLAIVSIIQYYGARRTGPTE